MEFANSRTGSWALLGVACLVAHAFGAVRLPAQPGWLEGPVGSVTLTPLRDGSHDFDFLEGTWQLVHIENQRPLSGYGARNRAATGRWLLRAEGDRALRGTWEALARDSTRVSGSVLLSYDRKSKQWTIRESGSDGAPLEPPAVGQFEGGIGSFYGVREYAGRTVLVRISFVVQGLDRARIERAFSIDGGSNWETHLIMHLWRGLPPPDARPSASSIPCCPSVEMLRYSVPPRKDGALVSLFERESEATRDSTPARYVALFRDLDRPGVYVWVRGFGWSGEARAFYHGPLWTARRDALERVSIHADSVYELQPALSTHGFAFGERAASGAATDAAGLVVATVYERDMRRDDWNAFPAYFAQAAAPRLVAAGAKMLAAFDQVTNYAWREARSDVAGRPAPTEKQLLVTFTWFADTAAYARHREALERDAFWGDIVLPRLLEYLTSPPATWRLVPVRERATFHESWDTPRWWGLPP